MSIDGPGREQLRTLAARLKDAGTEGMGFRKELMRQLTEAAKPLAREIGSVEHLKPYMPDRYAAVLAADLDVKTERHVLSTNPSVTIRARARDHERKLGVLERGLINHPVYARGPNRRKWAWKNGQTGGMRPGFFREACERAAPDVRERMLIAVAETAKKIAADG
jgi:hypothetical protein